MLVSFFVLLVGSYENYRVNVETVKISPLPITGISNADITITGYTASIPNGAIVELTIAEASAGDPITSSIKTYNLCDIVRCPIRPGRFSFTLSKIFSNKELKGVSFFLPLTTSPRENSVIVGSPIFGFSN